MLWTTNQTDRTKLEERTQGERKLRRVSNGKLKRRIQQQSVCGCLPVTITQPNEHQIFVNWRHAKLETNKKNEEEERRELYFPLSVAQRKWRLFLVARIMRKSDLLVKHDETLQHHPRAIGHSCLCLRLWGTTSITLKTKEIKRQRWCWRSNNIANMQVLLIFNRPHCFVNMQKWWNFALFFAYFDDKSLLWPPIFAPCSSWLWTFVI